MWFDFKFFSERQQFVENLLETKNQPPNKEIARCNKKGEKKQKAIAKHLRKQATNKPSNWPKHATTGVHGLAETK